MRASWLCGFLLVFVLAGCTPPAPARPSEAGTDSGPVASAPKRFTAAIRGNPHTVYQKLNPRSNVPGIDALERLVHTGLTVEGPDGAGRLGRLAEAPATVENDNWKLRPDGTMETRWTIKNGAVWADGSPFTSEDLVFTARMVRDARLPILNNTAFASLGTVEAVDTRTVVAHWTQAYIYADKLFGDTALPVAKSKLEQAYLGLTDQEQFLSHPYWSTQFVGAGPYRIKDWEPGSHLTVEANDLYILGRPKIDEITVRFIPDPNTIAANLLAGAIDQPWGGRIGPEWARTVAEQWRDGKLETRFASMIQIFVQFINPTPAILANVEFRRAMVHALDRQTMVDTIMSGETSIGHTFVAPNEPEYPFIQSAIVKYDYDPRKALSLLEGLGYSKGSDGTLRDRGGQRLAFQIRTSQGDLTQEPGMFASADNWQRLGVEVERHLVPPQRASDYEYRTTYPAFDVKRQGGTMDYAANFHSDRIALPENNYLAAGNNSRYGRPEINAAVDRLFTTIPWETRMEYGRQIVRQISEDVAWIGLYYDIVPSLVPNRVLNLRQAKTELGQADFIHEWDLKS